MSRTGPCALALFLAVTCIAGSSLPDPPVISFSFYAPVQNESPVRIVGFENDRHEIRFVLFNTSDKAVAGVDITDQMIPPPGCAVRSDERISSISRGGFPVLIAPHGKAVASENRAHYPKMLVHRAQDWGAPYLQAQFGITAVLFEDGTTWPTQVDHRSRVDPFDRELVKSDARNCSHAADVAALDRIHEVVFSDEIPVSSRDGAENTPPHLRFSCSLEGSKAICRLPTATDGVALQPETRQR
jgi:hypothetical protein